MITACGLFLVFVTLASSLIGQGVQQMQRRSLYTHIAGHLDQWTEEAITQSFAQPSEVGWFEKEVMLFPSFSLLLRWRQVSLQPHLAGFYFELHDPTTTDILHTWKTARFH